MRSLTCFALNISLATTPMALGNTDSLPLVGEAQIESARVSDDQMSLVFQVSYSGGCGTHEFVFEAGRCLETFPLTCDDAKLLHFSDDVCTAGVSKTIEISLEEANLSARYYDGAYMVINNLYPLNLPSR